MDEQDRAGEGEAILATVLGVSLGLCGVNFFLVIRFVPLGGPGPQPGVPEPPAWPGYILGPAAYLELAAIIGSIIGLCVVGLKAISRRFPGSGSEEDKERGE